MMTHYTVLGISITASAEEIKKAYLKSIRETHPDLSGGGIDGGGAAQINEAYRVLNSTRASYDRTLEETDEEVQSWGDGTQSWGQDDGWEDAEISDPDIKQSPSRIAATAIGWALIPIGGLAAFSLLLLPSSSSPPAAVLWLMPILIFSLITAAGVRGYSAGVWWWNSLTTHTPPRAGAADSLLVSLSFGLMRFCIASLGFILLAGIGWLSIISLLFLAATGGLTHLGWLSALGVCVMVAGGVTARSAPWLFGRQS
jgi:hypothetical protein